MFIDRKEALWLVSRASIAITFDVTNMKMPRTCTCWSILISKVTAESLESGTDVIQMESTCPLFET